ncbi:hypothetical protein F5I97DRAFT_1461172 [Phlebopus sp. FC_14]|nr:hypothetical protein F5I97DRAFT_1461172 [Phlebopus sp. FC_14]
MNIKEKRDVNSSDRLDLDFTNTQGNIVEVKSFATVAHHGARLPPGVPEEFFVNSRGTFRAVHLDFTTARRMRVMASDTMDLYILDVTRSVLYGYRRCNFQKLWYLWQGGKICILIMRQDRLTRHRRLACKFLELTNRARRTSSAAGALDVEGFASTQEFFRLLPRHLDQRGSRVEDHLARYNASIGEASEDLCSRLVAI